MLESIGYYILDEPSVQALYKIVSQNLTQESLQTMNFCRSQL